ncbi:MAG: V-type ATP synthase subunit I [Clostridiaceae bacterium]
MSIEKMKMVNILGHLDDLDILAKNIVLSDSMHMVDAKIQLDTSNFSIQTNEENKQALEESSYITPYLKQKEYTDVSSKMSRILELNTVKFNSAISEDNLIWDYSEIEIKINNLYEKFNKFYENIKFQNKEKEDNEEVISHLEFLKKLDIPISHMSTLKNFVFTVYRVSKINMLKLRDNYDNIPSIIIKISESEHHEVFIAFTPFVLKIEAERVFKSLNCKIITVPENFEGKPLQIMENLINRNKELDEDIYEENKEVELLSKQYYELINILSKSLELEIKAEQVKANTGCTKDFFFLSGWVPESFYDKFIKKINKLENKFIVDNKSSKEVSGDIIVPTKLKNNILVKPFESMVNMYGIPSYNEIDPTTFLAITYMILFGAMFGDLGQGLVIFFAGLFLEHKMKRTNLGGLLARLGISSSIFGLFYGSVFGFEVIPALIVRPMEDINDVLIAAIVFGCILIISGFILGLINNIKTKNVEEGLFGNNGLTGLVFYIFMLLLLVSVALDYKIFESYVFILVFIVLAILMIMKKPLTNFILHKKPLEKGEKSDYYVESVFGVLETTLSLFSNTLSFIRVGAFAINHVGLFIAFTTIAEMMRGNIGSTIVYIIGNIIILGLEGLIVFIQGLRLEYYELFSKYYDGSGSSFEPITINKNYFLENEFVNNKFKKAINQKN